MKNLYKSLALLGIILFCAGANAQTNTQQKVISPQQWDEMKMAGTLNNTYTTWDAKSTHPEFHPQVQASTHIAKGEKSLDVCSCFQTLDSTWAVVPFNGYTAPDYRNDDGSSPLTTIPFNFCFYGGSYNQVYIK